MSDEGVFAVFCLENYKMYKSMTGREVSVLFDRYGVFDYLREFYDVLHTTGYQYLNHDIDTFLAYRRREDSLFQTGSSKDGVPTIFQQTG